jgi:tRNA modification GTPase
MHENQVIVARSTAAGSGAIAIVRVTGNGACEVVDSISVLASGKKITECLTHTIHYGSVVDATGATIDHVLFMVMHGPKTFTGQDTVEINCHNNPFIIEAIIATAIAAGARLAHNGEFTRRAVHNEKIDLLQAEAINELIHANTQMNLKQSLAQMDGSLSAWIQRLEKNCIKALAFCESSFEFLDEEMTFDAQIRAILENCLHEIVTIKQHFDQQQRIRSGVRIAIIGAVNAGKSSLFNALFGAQRAIVSEVAGTTRDVIEAGMYKNGNYWTVIDTAGLRYTNDCIEQEGIKRSYEQAHLADIILLVVDGTHSLTAGQREVYDALQVQYAHKIIPIYSKSDLVSGNAAAGFGGNYFAEGSYVTISAKNNSGIAHVEQRIQALIDQLFKSAQSPFLLNQRQFNLILGLEKMLQEIVCQLDVEYVQHELIAYHLNDALAHLSELTGKTISEQAMDVVFREFCVGK